MSVIGTNRPRLIEFASFGDASTGILTLAELAKDIPFEVERVFWTHVTPPDVIRGGHAHRRTQTVLLAVSGSIEVTTEMLSGRSETFVLDRADMGLHLPRLCWHTMKYSEQAVQLAFESEEYLPDDYIRSLEEFRSLRTRPDPE
jgi:dTDP-4-dehydrorhamnose 3,5-epimerase-like enzyme